MFGEFYRGRKPVASVSGGPFLSVPHIHRVHVLRARGAAPRSSLEKP